MNAPAPTRPVAIKLDEDIEARVKRLARARKRIPQSLIREAISQYVEREGKRGAFRQDSLNAWTTYQQTGLHVTALEADAWLEQLEQGKDVEPPEGHA